MGGTSLDDDELKHGMWDFCLERGKNSRVREGRRGEIEVRETAEFHYLRDWDI